MGVAAALSLVAGCGSGNDGPSEPPPPATGSLAVTITGLPTVASAAVTVSGPSGFSRTLTATETLTSLTPGSYTITSGSVTAADGRYAPTPATLAVTVAAGSTPATAAVSYALATGSLTVTISGLPAGTSGSVTVTGPGGFSRTLTATQTLVGIDPGSYTVAAGDVSTTDNRYVPSPAQQTISVNAGTAAATANVAYALASGRLIVTIAGLAQGLNANVLVSGPNAFSRTLTTTTTIGLLAPGNYTVSTTDVTGGNFTYRGAPATQTLPVAASADPAQSTVTYTAIDGALTVAVAGLPTGVSAAITVTGPGGFSQTLTAATTLVRLPAGTYTVSASNVTSGAASYAPSR